MANVFEEIRNTNGVLYKLKGKLSEYKVVNITLVPKTKLAYLHMSGISKALKNNGKDFDKNLAKSVSLNMEEVGTLRGLLQLTNMDVKVQELVNSGQTQGRKRKADPEWFTTSGKWLSEYDIYQRGTGMSHSPPPAYHSAAGTNAQPTAFASYQQPAAAN